MKLKFIRWVVTATFTLGVMSEALGDSFAYLITNPDGPNGVEGYSRNADTGALTRLGRYDTGGMGDSSVGGFQQHSIVSDGKFVYAVNPGSDNISAFRIRPDGSLKLLGQTPSGGRRPVSIALTNGLLYVANQGNSPGAMDPVEGSYSGFTVASNGTLQAITGSTITLNPGDSLGDAVFSTDGKVFIGTRIAGNRIDSFRVKADGRLGTRRTTLGGGGPFGALFNPRKPWQLAVTLAVPEFFPNQSAPGVALYNVERNGVIGILDSYTDPDTSDAGLRDPCWVAFTPNGKYFWISSFIPRTLALFGVTDDETLERLSTFNPEDSEMVDDPENPGGPQISVVIGSTDIVVDKQGKFLYQLRVFSVPDAAVPVNPRIEVLNINRNWEMNGGLTPTQSVPLPADLAGTAGVMGMVIVDR